MKENNFYSDDFEQLIRGKTEQYKMYPSENVWKGVHSALHTKRKWFIGSMAVLVTGILFMAGRELIAPSNHVIVLHKPPTTGKDIPKTATNMLHTPLAVLRPSNTTSLTRHTGTGDSAIPEELDPASAGISITLSHPVVSQSDLSEWLSHVVQLPAQAPDLTVLAAKSVTPDPGKESSTASRTDEQTHPGAVDDQSRSVADDQGHTTNDGTPADGLTARSVLESLSAAGAHEGRYARSGAALDAYRSKGAGIHGKDKMPDSASRAAKASAAAIAEAEDAQRVNWLHDYALNILEPTPKTGRTFLQFSLAPTMSYRNLGGSDPAAEKLYLPGGPSAPLGGPNAFISHSPAFGFEANGSIIYRLTRNLSIKGGLQFNFIRYSITAYKSNRVQSGGSAQTSYGYALDSASAPPNTPASTVMRSTLALSNDYFQLSAPVGFELRVLGNERLQLNIAGTIAPSYLLNSTSYYLAEGYTKFDKEPEKYRKFNLYAGGEVFLSYKMGDIRWQIGPEFRYQLLSSYISTSPITEMQKGYGLKIGITKPLP